MSHLADDERRQQFLDALEADEDDEATRLVYSDWLEEQGEDEESQRQREWTQSKAWLKAFVERHSEVVFHDHVDVRNCDNYDAAKYDFYGHCATRQTRMTSYERLILLGREASKNGNWTLPCGADEELAVALWDHRDEFWRNWSIVTGISPPGDD